MNRILSICAIIFLAISISCKQEQENKGNDDAAAHDHQTVNSEDEKQTKKPLSPRLDEMADIGDVHIHINYSSPGVRGRTIWGGLVAYDQVWVTGAHKATSISFSDDVSINGQSIPAGKYGFFTIPGKEKWTVILNTNHEQHLADDYNQEEDIARFEVVPEELSEVKESLTYEVKPTEENQGKLAVMWELKKISLDISVP